jgi:hypothetical protein
MHGRLIKKSFVYISGTVQRWNEVKTQYNNALYSKEIFLKEVSAQARYAKGAFVIYIGFPRIRSPPFLLDCPKKIKNLRRFTNENY